MSAIEDIARAIAQLGDARFLRILFVSLGLTVLCLAGFFWGMMTLLGAVLPDTISLPFFGAVSFPDDLAFWAGAGLMLAVSVVLMVPVAAFVVGFFLEGVVVAVEDRFYPFLPASEGPGLGETIRDSLRFLGLVIAANLVALVIYLFVAPLAPVIFWLVNGFLLGREYFSLVASRRLGLLRAKQLRQKHGLRIFLLGTGMAFLLSVPLLNLIVPILGVAVFTHQFHRLIGTAAVV
ncbi:MAG: EI24 domain-containing protein [Pseudomonadota bacterium]